MNAKLLFTCLVLSAARTLSADSGQNGIAAGYSGDAGIAKDPAVIFAEDFEGKDFSSWDSSRHPGPPSVELVTDSARVHSGKQSVQFMVPAGKGVGAGLVKWFKPGYD